MGDNGEVKQETVKEESILTVYQKGNQFRVDVKTGVAFSDVVYGFKLLELMINEGIMMSMAKNKLGVGGKIITPGQNSGLINPNFIDRLRGL